ncbi:uncharacterized protein LOC128064101 [Budorcas taxicolor]|uniref:uncharacterized protein LOC128064101 n=1 Tax=Budorcas taxicolor TaxID=37181 RepID=UPI0022836708|nr:uncharacterized protein LOC128064101 [Budorcas taxicolor]
MREGTFPAASGREFRSRCGRASFRERLMVERRPRGPEHSSGTVSLGPGVEGERDSGPVSAPHRSRDRASEFEARPEVSLPWSPASRGPFPPTVSRGSGRCGSTDEAGAGQCDLRGCVRVLLPGGVGAARGSSETPVPRCDAGELCTGVIAGTCSFQVSWGYPAGAGGEPGVPEEVDTAPVRAEKTWRRPRPGCWHGVAGVAASSEQGVPVSQPQMRTAQAEPSIHMAHPCDMHGPVLKDSLAPG